MCKSGTVTEIKLCKPAGNGLVTVKVDSCIASIIQALNDGGIETVASCCGHGNRPGVIHLGDGRELWIVPDYETGKELDKRYPDIWGDKR